MWHLTYILRHMLKLMIPYPSRSTSSILCCTNFIRCTMERFVVSGFCHMNAFKVTTLNSRLYFEQNKYRYRPKDTSEAPQIHPIHSHSDLYHRNRSSPSNYHSPQTKRQYKDLQPFASYLNQVIPPIQPPSIPCVES